MVDPNSPGESAAAGEDASRAISIVQRGNLKSLEQTLRKQWRLGQNIVLAKSLDGWRAIGAEEWVLSVLREGYKIPFTSLPPVTSAPLGFRSYQCLQNKDSVAL